MSVINRGRSLLIIHKNVTVKQVPKTTGGKRGPSAPIASSDEDEVNAVNESRESLSSGCRDSPIVSSATSSTDYENVASPCSTSSGPIYVRQPGFEYHGHCVIARPKIKKKKTMLSVREGLKKREPVPPKTKNKYKEPIPMRMRALPQSFWQQPNVPHAPGTVHPVLPPLCKESAEDVTDIRPVTPPNDTIPEKGKKKVDEAKKLPRPPDKPERQMTVANTDLLFRLFDKVNKEGKEGSSSRLRRGRPRKDLTASHKALARDDDPFIVDAISEKLFPQLSLDGNGKHIGGNHSLQLITLREGDKSITLPSLSLDQNFSQMLSELVSHI